MRVSKQYVNKEMTFMISVQVLLNSIDKVKGFVNNVSKFEDRFELKSGRYSVDAKSILGIFSLNLTKPICLNIYTEGNADQIMDVLACYII